jgi:hypothetical protein
MAIVKNDAVLESLTVDGSGNVLAVVNYAIVDNSTNPDTIITRNRTQPFIVSNATTAEKTSAASLVSKANALAVA